MNRTKCTPHFDLSKETSSIIIQLTYVHHWISCRLEDIILPVGDSVPPLPLHWRDLEAEYIFGVCGDIWCWLSPHLSGHKVSDKAVQIFICNDRSITIQIWEVIHLSLVADSKSVWEADSCCINLGCNIWHVVLCTVICAKCSAVWEGCVWSCVSSSWEDVSDAHHPQVTAGCGAGGGAMGSINLRLRGKTRINPGIGTVLELCIV